LLTEMKYIDKKELDKETEWVVEPVYENMHVIMQIVQSSVFINPDNMVMFVLQVPRIDKTKFKLYKVVPVPSCDERRVCKFITPHSQYIGFEDKNKFYVRLADISTCTPLDDITLCFGSMTVKYVSYSNDCDVKMFYGHSTHNRCEVHASKFYSEIFYSLNNVNKWLFMVDKPVMLQLNCGTGNFNLKTRINGTGVITLLKYCKLKTSRTVLVSKHVPTLEEMEQHKIAHFDFGKFYLTPAYSGTQVIKSLDYDSLHDVTRSLKRLLTNEQAEKELKIPQPGDESNADWYINLFGNWWWELKFFVYTVCFVIIVVIVLYVRRNCCCCGGAKNVVLPIFSPKY